MKNHWIDKWHLVHDFIRGYGWKNGDWRVWFHDVEKFFPELKDDLWERLGKDWDLLFLVKKKFV